MKTTSQRNSLQVNTKVSRHKRSKPVKPAKLEISIKQSASIKNSVPIQPRRTSEAHDIARQLKQRLSDAMLRVTSGSLVERKKSSTDAEKEEDHNATVAVEPPPHRLHNMRLLKQYLLFVAQETSIDIQRQNNGDHKIVILVGEDDECPSAHPGARLIEAQVHSQSTMLSVLEGEDGELFRSTIITLTLIPHQQPIKNARSSRLRL
ncbi:hypothetical protein BX666DRAFT_1963101 [Dichotomocladium elegans]|nr:hypothetical protein BX666DRAFT_1963101 [Dichotomocladium elegans]